jgi:dynein heavy chain
MPELEKLQEK